MSQAPAELLAVAVSAARKAGAIISAAANHIDTLTIEQKSLNDFVSEIDRHSERSITDLLLQAFPSHKIIGEEYGSSGEDASTIVWYVDPLDGTTNFLRSIPHYCVSIAAYRNEQPLVSVVFDPTKDELFTATLGGGAWLNDRPIKTSASPSLHGALLATGVPYSGTYLAQLPQFLGTMQSLLAQHTSGIRRLGSAALDLAYVAAGRYDGYWEAGLKPWDIGAGMLLVQEAGGLCSDLAGGRSCMQSGDILAATPKVHSEMLTITSAHYS